MACSGTEPSITAWDVSTEGSCSINLDGTIDIPCGSTGYVAKIYKKKGSAPTFDPGELIQTIPLPDGPDTYVIDETDDVTNEGQGAYHYAVRIECDDGSSTHGSSSDSVTISDTVTISEFTASYDAPNCVIHITGRAEIPCITPAGGTAKLYRKLGSAASSSDTLVQTIPLVAGPDSQALNFDDQDLACEEGGVTWHYHLLVEADGGSDTADTNADFDDADPVLSNIRVNIDQNCDYTLTADVTTPCGVPNDKFAVRAYYRYASPLPAAPAPQSLIGTTDVICGPSAQNLSYNGTIKADGKHYWKVCLYEFGVLIQTLEVEATTDNCEPIDGGDDGTAVPHEGIDELLYLVEVDRTGAQAYTYTDKRILSKYQLMEWNYHRRGGCGSFRLTLREDFPEAGIAIREGWEIHVRIKLPDEDEYTTWYRGVIRNVKRQNEAQELITEVAGQGYLEQLANVQVHRRYPKGLRVDQIVADIINTFVLPNTRILRTSATDGIDSSSYVTEGPLHFECSALKAIRFLAELQGDREFGVAADRQFFFRAKSTTIRDALFQTYTVASVLEGGKGVQKVNEYEIGGKLWGHKLTDVTYRDATDVSNYGLFERPVDVPHIEHRLDGTRWAFNVIEQRKGVNSWAKVAWSQIDARLERDHPDAGLRMVRLYGEDVSNEITDLDITKITYYKGGYHGKAEVREIHEPKAQTLIDQPVLRAFVYVGLHHHDLVEELEEKVYDPIGALKQELRQFKNPVVDVTNPNPGNTERGQLWAQPISSDVTNGPHRMRFLDDLTNWTDFVRLRYGDVLPAAGQVLGEEFFLYSNPPTRTQGTKYYWNGVSWSAM